MQTIDILRSFNIDMTLSIDNYSSLNENTCGALVKEYGKYVTYNSGDGEGVL